VDTQGSGYVDPADQWVLDPVTGTYQLRLGPAEPAAPGGPAQEAYGTADRAAGATGYAGGAGDTGDTGYAAPAAGPAAEPRPATRTAERPAARRRAGSGRGGRRAGTPAAATPSRRRSRKSRKGRAQQQKTLLWTAGTIALAVLAGGLGGYFAFRDSPIAIHTVDVGNAGSSAPVASGPLNLLLIGTDSRAGLGHEYGPADRTGSADTLMLLHVAADRASATAVSIPPGLVTDIPECPVGDQVVKGAQGQPVSSVLAGRDPGCAMRLVAQLTGVRVDHFLMVDYAAVTSLSTEVGGVGVCLNEPLSDPKSHLSLGTGPHTVAGAQALALVRTRQALPGRDDLARVAVQEQFLAGLLRKVRSEGSLTDPKKTLTLARTAARALTVDSPIGSVGALDAVARAVGKVDPKEFTFATLPVKAAQGGAATSAVVLDQAPATQLFSLVKRDIPLDRKAAPPDPKLVGSKTTPHDTRVTVHNGSGIMGASQDVLNWLQNDEGVNRSDNGGDAPEHVAKTFLKYAPNQADQARRLAEMMGLPASALVEGTQDAAPLEYMSLTLGADYTAPGVPIAPPTTPPKGLKTLTGDSTACVG